MGKARAYFFSSSTKRHPKLLSHAANPLPVHMDGDTYRVFFSGRDSENRSSVGAVDIDIVQRKVIREHYNPFFENGTEGSFYSDGVSIGNCYSVNGNRYMLFMGWHAPRGEHKRGVIGRLIVNSDLSLRLDMSDPFLQLDEHDPISISYPWVIGDEASGYCMWYGSTKVWDAGNGEMIHVINYAFSSDGHIWDRAGLSIPYKVGVAQAFSRPTVIKNTLGTYEMWFSYRSGSGEKYRIGYAHCPKGKKWDLDLAGAGIDVSPDSDAWDSEMIEYPFVFNHKGQKFMLYNGNGYGRTGFGLAVLRNG